MGEGSEFKKICRTEKRSGRFNQQPLKPEMARF
jgi:hypothetical protein